MTFRYRFTRRLRVVHVAIVSHVQTFKALQSQGLNSPGDCSLRVLVGFIIGNVSVYRMERSNVTD